MLKHRVIACLVIKNGIVVQSIGFNRYLPVGKVSVAIEFLSSWGIDEIVLLDIDALHKGPNFDLLATSSSRGFVPLTVGGGIKSIKDMQKILQSGADKICINYAAIHNPKLVKEGAENFGRQCIVVSIDVDKNADGVYEIFCESGKKSTGLDPFDFAQKMEKQGAGEIFLNSIARDGSKKGYDLELITKMANSVNIPLIVCGGVGHPKHFLEGIQCGNVSAVAAANFFHFTEHSATIAKSYLYNNDIDVRLDSYANYKQFDFLESGRIAKKSDEELAKLIFEYIPKEKI